MEFFARKEMMRSSSVEDGNVPSTSSKQQPIGNPSQIPRSTRRSGKNVFQLLARREICPRSKHTSKRLWGDTHEDRIGLNCEVMDAKHGLVSWVEAESLKHISAKYCSLVPPPRSTIAAAFSPDGRTLASTHGDHTVKIIDCQTGNCLKVLSGHRRTPWVVRFHPVYPEILASGSLDHEVRLWDANTAECLGSRDFLRPIASIAFHAQGELLAVASGHKLHIWHYNKRGEGYQPIVVLKTRRSLRAVHFHPHAAPFLLTAEVNDLDSLDSPMTLATSAEEGRPSLQHGNRSVSSLQEMVDSSASLQPQIDINIGMQDDYLVSPMDVSPMIPSSSYNAPEDLSSNNLSSEMENAVPDSGMDIMETAEGQPTGDTHQNNSPVLGPSHGRNIGQTSTTQSRENVEVTPGIYLSNLSGNAGLQMLLRSGEIGQMHQFFPFGDPMFWELPYLQGWLMGQSQAGLHPMLSLHDGLHENSAGFLRSNASDNLAPNLSTRNVDPSVLTGVSHPLIGGHRPRHRSSRSRAAALAGSGEGATFINIRSNVGDPPPVGARTETELATTLAAAAAAAELPCTVKLRIWPHDIKDPCALLDAAKCRLIIPHAVLCSEMGAHFSPCGRFLAACVACMLPHMEADPGLQSHMNHETGASTSPTRHPISAHQVMYELRIYSLEEATFGLVLASRAIRAAHCLTSIQFSPTSEHILLAYGRRHSSLLRSLVIDADTTMPIYTILEVYKVSDMELVRVLPSAEDEVNVACFHPLAGGGLVYGTKEGKLRILQYDGSSATNCTRPNFLLEENMPEVPTYALEG